MLWAVTSSARCWASRPLSVVFRPKKEEIDIALRRQVERAESHARRGRGRGRRAGLGGGGGARGGPRGGGGGRAARGGGGVAGVGLRGVHQPRQVVEEGELLAHEGPVGRVLAG